MIYRFTDNNWHTRDVKIEGILVLCYDIMPSQVIIAFKIFNKWVVIFRDKWTNKNKFLLTN